jgi:hypothetical protein
VCLPTSFDIGHTALPTILNRMCTRIENEHAVKKFSKPNKLKLIGMKNCKTLVKTLIFFGKTASFFYPEFLAYSWLQMFKPIKW